MKKGTVFLFLLFPSLFACSQTLNYTFSAISGAFTYNSSPTYLMGPGGGADAYCTCQGIGPINIGFTFQYGCTNYTTFDMTEDGWINLSNNCIPFSTCVFNSDAVNLLAGSAAQTANNLRPVIAPLWDDLVMDVTATSSLNYQLTGSGTTQVLTVEWRNMIWCQNGLSGTISFQVKLYQTTNVIEFIYKQEGGAVNSSCTGFGASIGLEGPSGTDYYSLNPFGGNTFASPGVNHNVSEVKTINARPATGQIYRWIPVCTLPIELVSFTGKNHGEFNQLSWITSSETNNDYFTLERSIDGIQFYPLTTLKGAGNSIEKRYYNYPDKDLGQQKLYYYKLKQTDFDGNFKFFNIVAIDRETDDQINYHIENNTFHFETDLKEYRSYIIQVYDVLGQIIAENKYLANPGFNNFSFSLSFLPKGVYFVRIFDKERLLLNSKFIIDQNL